jgi:hypothetical protein
MAVFRPLIRMRCEEMHRESVEEQAAAAVKLSRRTAGEAFAARRKGNLAFTFTKYP